jgi:hypothetical protein
LRSDRTHGQCHLTWKDCFGCPTASLLEDEIPKPPNAGRVRSPLGTDPKRLVFRSLHDVSCRMSPSGGSVCRDLAIGQEGSSHDEPANRIVDLASAYRFAARGREGLVGREGVEPSTSRLSGVRSNHLSYRPNPVGSADPASGGACRAGGATPRIRRASPRKWWSLPGSNR